jgi:hypothetical protein
VVLGRVRGSLHCNLKAKNVVWVNMKETVTKNIEEGKI